MSVDRWGLDIAGEPASIRAWNSAWDEFLHFRGDPIATLAYANEHDESFVMGPVFCALYAVLGGVSLEDRSLILNVDRARQRVSSGGPRERHHVRALEMAARGDLSAAAAEWDPLFVRRDFAAARFRHDVFLHIGDAHRRADASSGDLGAWAVEPEDGSGWSAIVGMAAFSFCEVGEYSYAEELGRTALEADPLDLWARHALAHIYEETDQTDAALALLRDTTDVWADQDALANHIWWHLALRLLATGDLDGALDAYDDTLPTVTTAFRLCDHTSLLWRAELAGFDIGDRWDALADRWDTIAERHTCGFLDLHATLAFTRRPDHPGAQRWFDGLDARPRGDSELDRIFDEVVKPLVGAFRARAAGDTRSFHHTLGRLGDTTARIGGSNAQRALITLTREATPA